MKINSKVASWALLGSVSVLLAGCGGGDNTELMPVRITTLAAGDAHCANGGASFTQNGRTLYACNGVDGAAGVDGANGVAGLDGANVTMEALPVNDAHCPYGGVALTAAADVRYVCNGAPGPVGKTYTIPGMGGTFLGGYLQLPTTNRHVSLYLTCNYGFAGDNEAYFFAESPVVTTGSAHVTVDIDGHPLAVFDDLNWNSGGQDRAFADTGYQSTWPWHGVFTVSEAGTVTRWDVTLSGSATGDCTAVVFAQGGAVGRVVHP